MKKTRTHAAQTHEQKLMNFADDKFQTQVPPKRNGATDVSVEQMWNRFSAQLGQFIRARVAHPATAEDILHDVFLKFQSRLDEFRNPAKIRGWLFLVARNAIIDHYRTRKPTSELSESLPVDLTGTIDI
jgi:RNA polymerase sigma-70 factor (ECF subfamily)